MLLGLAFYIDHFIHIHFALKLLFLDLFYCIMGVTVAGQIQYLGMSSPGEHGATNLWHLYPTPPQMLPTPTPPPFSPPIPIPFATPAPCSSPSPNPSPNQLCSPPSAPLPSCVEDKLQAVPTELQRLADNKIGRCCPIWHWHKYRFCLYMYFHFHLPFLYEGPTLVSLNRFVVRYTYGAGRECFC